MQKDCLNFFALTAGIKKKLWAQVLLPGCKQVEFPLPNFFYFCSSGAMAGRHSLNYHDLFSTQEVSLLDALLDGSKTKETQSPAAGVVLQLYRH